MKKELRNKKGITLIALVITIIVLLILAGVSISMISSQDGILKKTTSAKEMNKKAEYEEAVKLALQAAMVNENAEVDYDNIDKYLTGAQVDKDAKIIKYNENNYQVKKDGTIKEVAWYVTTNNDNKYVVTNGKGKEILLGAIINYDPYTGVNNEELTVTPYENKLGGTNIAYRIANNQEQKLIWKVIGTDDDGNILIMSTKNATDSTGTIQKLRIGGEDFETTKMAVKYAVEEVNRICGIYGHGKGAKSARSVQVEDIDRLAEYDKTKYEQDSIYEYGHNVTYTKTSNGIDYIWGETTGSTGESKFEYLGENGNWNLLINEGDSITVKATYYSYRMSEMSTWGVNLKGKDVYELITADTSKDNNPYWIASSYVGAGSRYANYGMRYVCNSYVNGYSLANSNGNCYSDSYGLRPVVSLNSDVEFTEKTENDVIVYDIN